MEIDKAGVRRRLMDLEREHDQLVLLLQLVEAYEAQQQQLADLAQPDTAHAD